MRELTIVYDGPGLAGRYESIRYLHRVARDAGPFESKYNEERGRWAGFRVVRPDYSAFVKAVTGAVYYSTMFDEFRAEADAIVFVVDSQPERIEANTERMEAIERSFLRHGSRGVVMQYNKRDLPDVMPVEELSRRLNVWHAPEFATIAPLGENIVDAFRAAVALAKLRL